MMNQQFGNQIDRIHQQSLFQGASQYDNAQVGRIQQNTISGHEQHPLSAGFGMSMGGQSFNNSFAQQGFQQGVSQHQLDRIHQNSLYQGESSGYGSQPVQHTQARSMQAGMMAAPQYNQGGFGQAYNQGLQQSVSQQQLERIHQNSLYNGAPQSNSNQHVQQIHAQTMQAGMMAAPQYSQAGYSQGMQPSAYGQAYSQGMQQGVSQQQLERIHQNSLYNGASSSMDNNQHLQHIQAASMQAGTMAAPQYNNAGAGFGGLHSGMSAASQGMQGANAYSQLANQGSQAYSQGMQGANAYSQLANQGSQAYGQGMQGANAYSQLANQGSQAYSQGMQGANAYSQLANQGSQAYGQGMQGANAYSQLANQGNQAYSQLANQGNQAYSLGMSQGSQGLQQGVSQQQLERVHQNSLYNGAQHQGNAAVQRIQAQTMQAGTMAAPQFAYGNPASAGASMGMGGAAYHQVMNADAGMSDNEGRTDVYPAAMYTGQNQYDSVNQSVMNQMANRQLMQ